MLSHHGRPDSLSNIAEELRCHILSLLSYRGIIRCALTCQTMYKTVKNSTELQYIIELGAHRLIPIHPRPPNVSIAECLRILRGKANAWSSFELGVTKGLRIPLSFNPGSIVITHQQLAIFATYYYGYVESKVIDLRTCMPETASISPCIRDGNYANPTLRGSVCSSSYIDETQDLMITVNLPRDNPTYQINFRAISTHKEHPMAHESRLELVCRVPYNDYSEGLPEDKAVFTGVGDRLAFYTEAKLGLEAIYGNSILYWSLHVWNWHEGGQPDEVYALGNGYILIEIRFLTEEKLLALTSCYCIELYDVGNLSTIPQLQARFMLPVVPQTLSLEYPSVFHGTSTCEHLAAPDERWIWTTIPADRVICLRVHSPKSIFVISARLFFMDLPPTWFDAASTHGVAIPWLSWGPQNSRCFLQKSSPLFGVGGSRVIRPVLHDSSLRMHMTDFNPSAVARGIGKVVQDPTTLLASRYGFTQDVTTYLPYVEVVNNDRDFDFSLRRIILDEEKILIFTLPHTTERAMDVEIIGM
ncbi:hypothetical protein K503DRAFT_597169 [Rhizopogon vinicolor AM-OR11-026]|uniref:F-box domain-containing protein n=1 Tax=Rhizopogon vinicolor AM-OR11-026 TaxID=1314800 RepID=A0A1B7N6W6_9AGAM|nr:hypothetical protein K503DRAFT_597169 [Rhizopogon vinicolor AM-OR11-026]